MRQVRFAFSQKKIVKDVISGAVDVGMVRPHTLDVCLWTLTACLSDSEHEIEFSLVKFLENTFQLNQHMASRPFAQVSCASMNDEHLCVVYDLVHGFLRLPSKVFVSSF